MTETLGQATARLTVQRETMVSGDWLKTSGDEPIRLAGLDLADLPIDSHTRWVIELAEPEADEVATSTDPVEPEPTPVTKKKASA